MKHNTLAYYSVLFYTGLHMNLLRDLRGTYTYDMSASDKSVEV